MKNQLISFVVACIASVKGVELTAGGAFLQDLVD